MKKRKLVFHAVVGSANYNLTNKNSDMDLKNFVLSNFDDLYDGGKYIDTKSTTSETTDIETHDIRRLPELLYKANVNFIEPLFSVDLFIPEGAPEQIYEIIGMRDDLARMNIPYLYDACMGMYFQRLKYISSHFDTTKDYKNAYSGLRILDFLVRFYSTGWDFKEAIWYADGTAAKDFLMKFKNGKATYSEFMEASEHYRDYLAQIKYVFKDKTLDVTTKEKVDKLVYQMVKDAIKAELRNN